MSVCTYILNAGEEVILPVSVDGTLLTGINNELVSTLIAQMKERFETVDVGDAKFILGVTIQQPRPGNRSLDPGSIHQGCACQFWYGRLAPDEDTGCDWADQYNGRKPPVAERNHDVTVYHWLGSLHKQGNEAAHRPPGAIVLTKEYGH